MAFTIGSGISREVSIPNGYGMSAWVPPAVTGGMAASTTLSGTSAVTANGAMGRNIEASLTGSGTISNALLSIIVDMAANLTGSGTISSAYLLAKVALVASLTGSGTIDDAELLAIANAAASLTGSGTLAATRYAVGHLSADITVVGGQLTTANAAETIWGSIVETGFTYEEAVRILLAVAAGKTTIINLGGGNAIVRFRDVNDTTNRVVADMVGSERSDVTLDTS